MEIKSVGMGYAGAGNVTSAPGTQVKAEESTPEVTDVSHTGQDTVTQSQQSSKSQNDQKDEKKGEPSEEQLQKAVAEINKKAVDSEAVFGIHEKTNRVTIKFVDKKTKDVIKEVPAEKTLDLIAKAWELAGILVDEKR